MERVSFSSLPYEILKPIWLMTFEPRVLCLHTHQSVTPGNSPGENSVNSKSTCHYTVAFSFTTARKKPCHVYNDYYAPRDPNHTHPLKNAYRSGCPQHPPTSPGPAALYVNRSSRAFALQHYHLAFPSSHFQISDSSSPCLWDFQTLSWKLSQKPPTQLRNRKHEILHQWTSDGVGTWINFPLDHIILDTLPRPSLPSQKGMMRNPLRLLELFAEDDLRKVEKITIGGDKLWRHKPPHPWVKGSAQKARNGSFCYPKIIVDDSWELAKIPTTTTTTTAVPAQRRVATGIHQRHGRLRRQAT